MNTDQIQLLIDLAQTHSFNKTAERLFTTQQNISYKVKQLERELQTTIFLRSSSGVEFTSSGEYVLQCAYEMDKAYRTLKDRLCLDDGNEAIQLNLLKFYISSVLLSSKMTKVIKEYNRVFPVTKLVIKEQSPEQLLRSLFSYKCDVAFWSISQGYFEPYRTECTNKGIISEVVQRDQAIAVVAKKSVLAEKEQLSLRDLSHQPKSIYGMLPLDYFGKNIESYILYENNNLDIHKQLILEENVICFTSLKTFEELFSEKEFVAKPFAYPTLPIEHMILKRVSVESKEISHLENLLIDIFSDVS